MHLSRNWTQILTLVQLCRQITLIGFLKIFHNLEVPIESRGEDLGLWITLAAILFITSVKTKHLSSTMTSWYTKLNRRSEIWISSRYSNVKSSLTWKNTRRRPLWLRVMKAQLVRIARKCTCEKRIKRSKEIIPKCSRTFSRMSQVLVRLIKWTSYCNYSGRRLRTPTRYTQK